MPYHAERSHKPPGGNAPSTKRYKQEPPEANAPSTILYKQELQPTRWQFTKCHALQVEATTFQVAMYTVPYPISRSHNPPGGNVYSAIPY